MMVWKYRRVTANEAFIVTRSPQCSKYIPTLEDETGRLKE